MILPFLEGIANFRRAPLTWLLIFINTLVCVITLHDQNRTKKELGLFYDQDVLIRAQGEIFADYISQHPELYDQLMLKMSDIVKRGDLQEKDILGRLAFRDRQFTLHAQSMSFAGDQVLFDYWKTRYQEIREVLDKDPANRWGLGLQDVSLVKWISYQFFHGGVIHLLSNMWFLLIFGSYLEPLLGSLLFAIVYLLSGFFAAGTFIELSGLSGAPLVGASGAVSGLMGVCVAFLWSEKTRFMFWLLPMKGYSGFILLPAWVLLIVWGLSDITGYLSTVPELGGVAHAAHIGGALHGLLMGCFFRIRSKAPPHSVLSHATRF